MKKAVGCLVGLLFVVGLVCLTGVDGDYSKVCIVAGLASMAGAAGLAVAAGLE